MKTNDGKTTSAAIVQNNDVTGKITLKSSDLVQVHNIRASGLLQSEVELTSNKPNSSRDGISVGQVQLNGDVNNTDSRDRSDRALDNAASTDGTFDTRHPTSTGTAPGE